MLAPWRPTGATTSAPASAPIAAAIAQPSINIRPTGTPTSRLDSGFDATARNASPILVRLSSRKRMMHSARSTPTRTSVSLEIWTFPGSHVLLG